MISLVWEISAVICNPRQLAVPLQEGSLQLRDTHKSKGMDLVLRNCVKEGMIS